MSVIPVQAIDMGSGSYFSGEDDCTTSEAKAKPYLTREFSLSGPGILRSVTPAGNIEIVSVSGSDKVKVELYIERGYAIWSNTKNLDNYRISILKRENEIIASVEQKTKSKGFFGDDMEFTFKIYVPERMSMELTNSKGNITLSGVTGEHIIKSYAGSIHLKDIKGHIRAFSSGGDIDIRNSRGTLFVQANGGNIYLDKPKGEIRARTKGGRIVSERVEGSFLARADGGDIYVQFNKVSEGINMQTTAGDIMIDLPADAGFDLNLEGSEISILDSNQFKGSLRQTSAEGWLRDGGPQVILRTHSGKVTVKSE